MVKERTDFNGNTPYGGLLPVIAMLGKFGF